MERQKMTADEKLQVLPTSVSLRSNFQILPRNASLKSSTASTFNTPINELAIQLELRRYELQPRSESDHDGSNTLQNVRYYSDDLEPSTPIFINCRLKNVDFIQCKFQDTEFCNLTLSNVTLLYVDLDNVALNGLDLNGHLWKTTIARNAVLVHKATKYVHGTRTTILGLHYPINDRRPDENTVIETRWLENVSPQTTKSIQRYQNCFKGSPQAGYTGPDLLVRLIDYKHIISQIVQHCVGKNDPFFERYARKPKAQIVTFRHASEPEAPGGDVHVYCPESTRDTCLAALALQYISTTKPTVINEYIPRLFETTQCTVSGPSKLRCDSSTPSVVLHYNFEGGTGFVKTDDETWHEPMIFIRHSASDIPHIHLYISKRFWGLARWKEGIKEVILQKSLRNTPNPGNFYNFLTKIAKIAAPAPRWRNHERRVEINYNRQRDEYYCARGTTLRITIDGADCEERQAFVQKLEQTIGWMQYERPLFKWNTFYNKVLTYTRHP
jgi:hypothetical protein